MVFLLTMHNSVFQHRRRLMKSSGETAQNLNAFFEIDISFCPMTGLVPAKTTVLFLSRVRLRMSNIKASITKQEAEKSLVSKSLSFTWSVHEWSFASQRLSDHVAEPYTSSCPNGSIFSLSFWIVLHHFTVLKYLLFQLEKLDWKDLCLYNRAKHAEQMLSLVRTRA